MAMSFVIVDRKLFQMMPYIILLKVSKFHWATANCFGAAKYKHVGDTVCCLNSLKSIQIYVNKFLKIRDTNRILKNFGSRKSFEVSAF